MRTEKKNPCCKGLTDKNQTRHKKKTNGQKKPNKVKLSETKQNAAKQNGAKHRKDGATAARTGSEFWCIHANVVLAWPHSSLDDNCGKRSAPPAALTANAWGGVCHQQPSRGTRQLPPTVATYQGSSSSHTNQPYETALIKLFPCTRPPTLKHLPVKGKIVAPPTAQQWTWRHWSVLAELQNLVTARVSPTVTHGFKLFLFYWLDYLQCW